MDFFPNKKDFFGIEREKNYDLKPNAAEKPGGVNPVNNHHGQERESKHKAHEAPRKEVKDKLKEITRAAELSNEKLEKAKSPFRFCIYEEEGEVYIDLVRLNKNNEVVETKKKKLTHVDFHKEISDIDTLEGLIIDDEA